MIAFPPRRIVVSYDFSARCREAWECARSLALRFGAALDAAHVRDWLSPDGERLKGCLPAAVRRRLEAAMLERLPGATRSGCRVLEGDAVPALSSLAGEEGLVVRAAEAQGRFGPDSPFEAFARRSAVPVLTVRGPVSRLESVLAPVGDAGLSGRGLELAARAALALEARLTLLQAPVGRFARRLSQARVERLLSTLPSELRAGAVVEAVDAAGARARASGAAASELVVLSSPRGAVAERLLARSHAALLVLPGPV